MSRIYSFYKVFKTKKHAYLISYTVLFCIVSLLMFWYFPVFHKSFIWQQDGLKQHYNGLLYYSKYLKKIISVLINQHKLTLPMWDFSIGYGSDIITTLHYYAVGDPLTLISAFVPVAVMEYFYAFLFFLRSYIGGLGFSRLSLSRGNSRFYTLMGALLYCFSAFGLVLGLMHGIFMVPVCYFPWIIYGIEKIYRGKSPVVFILSTAAAAAANFYFFYMEFVLAVLYALHLFIIEEKQRYAVRQPVKTYFQDFLKTFLRFILYGLDAFLLSAVILLPVLNLMFSSERFAAEKYVPVLYEVRRYLNIAADFMITRNAGSWTMMGYTAVGAFAVIFLFTDSTPDTASDKKRKQVRDRFLVLTLFILIPACGFFLNGFAYVTNRWTFAYALSVAMITATVLPDIHLFDPERKNRFRIVLFVLIWLGAAFFYVRKEDSLLSFVLLLALSIVLLSEETPRGFYKYAVFTVTILCLFLNGWYAFSTADSGFLDEFQDFHEADKNLTEVNPDSILDSEKDPGFFRTEISGLDTTQNSSIQTGFKGTQFYFSLTSPYVSDFINSMFLNWPKDYDYDGVESRAGLEALASVKYYIAGGGDLWKVPGGFEKIKEEDTASGHAFLYGNKNALPLGYTVDSFVSRQAFDEEKVTGRQSALLSGAVVSDEDGERLKSAGYREAGITDDSVDVLKDVTASGDMDLGDKSFTVRKNALVNITFEGTDDTETYLFFKGLKYKGYKERERYDSGAWAGLTPYEQAKVNDKNQTDTRPSVTSMMADMDGRAQILELYNPGNDFYCGRENFLINLGKTGSGEKTVTLSFRESGVYSFDSLEVRSQPLSSVFEKVGSLKKEVLQDIEAGQDIVTGNIEVSDKKILMLSIPYSTGWKAYVDGHNVRIMRGDLMYMAVPLEKGFHSVMLKYETPYLRAGAVMGVIGIVLFVFVVYLHKRWSDYES